jgi:hypothetical protein
VLPGFHAAQHLLLPFRRQAVKALQALLKLLLSVRRKSPELGIILQRAPLLVRRQVAVTIQPLTCVVTFFGRFIRPRSLVLLRWLGPGLVLRLRLRTVLGT